MKLEYAVLICLVVEISGCWKKSSPDTSTTKQTITTTQRNNIEDEIIPGSKVHESNAARNTNRNQGKGHKSGVETSELRGLSEALYQLDSNSVGSEVILNYQGLTSGDENSDSAPRPLFTSVGSKAFQGNTLKTFRTILDNYVPDVREREDNTAREKQEIDAFLDALMNTNVMKRTEQFLQQKRLISGSLRDALQLIWFTPYSRSRGITGSSGFEHVFLGEIKQSKVSGFHNWVYFQQEEAEKDLNYKGYMKSLDLGNKGEILKMRFDWLNYPKAVGSMFIGTSPELEMALYTVCFYARPNAGCNLQMNKQRFRIKVYQQTYQGKKLIGSAFPEIF